MVLASCMPVTHSGMKYWDAESQTDALRAKQLKMAR